MPFNMQLMECVTNNVDGNVGCVGRDDRSNVRHTSVGDDCNCTAGRTFVYKN